MCCSRYIQIRICLVKCGETWTQVWRFLNGIVVSLVALSLLMMPVTLETMNVDCGVIFGAVIHTNQR